MTVALGEDEDMSILSETKLGPYEILAPLGARGMGEVYRARDTRLGRSVAVKALPEEFAGDPSRLACFQREAKLLTSRHHLNIAHPYSFEPYEQESRSSGTWSNGLRRFIPPNRVFDEARRRRFQHLGA